MVRLQLLLLWQLVFMVPLCSVSFSTGQEFEQALQRADDLLDDKAYGSALFVYDSLLTATSPRKFPDEFARAQKGSADALYYSSLLTDSTDMLQEALNRYSNVLRLISWRSSTGLWINTKTMQARAFASLANYQDRDKNLASAAQCLEEIVQSGELAEYNSKRGFVYEDLAEIYRDLGKPDEARIYFERAIRYYERNLAETVPDAKTTRVRTMWKLVFLYNNMAEDYDGTGAGDKAVSLIREIDTLTPQSDSNDCQRRIRDRGLALSQLGGQRMDAAMLAEACRMFGRAVECCAAEADTFGEARNSLSLSSTLESWEIFDGHQSKLNSALDAAMRALSLTSPTRFPSVHFRAHSRLGSIYATLTSESNPIENADSALKYLNAAAAYYRANDDAPSLAHVNSNLAKVYFQRGKTTGEAADYVASIEIAKNVVSHCRSEKDTRGCRIALDVLGNIYTSYAYLDNPEANIKKAMAAFDESILLAEELGDPNGAATAQMNRGNALAALARIESPVQNMTSAIAAFQQAAAYFSKEKYPASWANAIYNVATAHSILANITDTVANARTALAYYDSLQSVLTVESDPMRIVNLHYQKAYCYHNLSLCENRIENSDSTYSCLEKARSLAEANGLTNKVFDIDCKMGGLLMERSSDDTTGTYIKRALGHYEAAQASQGWSDEKERVLLAMKLAETRLAFLRLRQSPVNIEETLALAQEWQSNESYLKDPQDSAFASVILGRARLAAAESRDPEANLTYAEEELRKGLTYICLKSDPDLCCEIKFDLAMVYSKRGYLLKSGPSFKKALELFQEVESCLTTEAPITTRLTNANNLADCYMQIARYENRLENIETAIRLFNALSETKELLQVPHLVELVRKNLIEANEIKSGD